MDSTSAGGGVGFRPPFTASGWAELEHQAIIFKYLIAGMPVPSGLLLPIRRSFETMASRFYHHPVLAYLLISASSSAATRNDDWISMFGRDEFTNKMNVSIALSFLAFFAFSFSSIISAYKLFSWSP